MDKTSNLKTQLGAKQTVVSHNFRGLTVRKLFCRLNDNEMIFVVQTDMTIETSEKSEIIF